MWGPLIPVFRILGQWALGLYQGSSFNLYTFLLACVIPAVTTHTRALMLHKSVILVNWLAIQSSYLLTTSSQLLPTFAREICTFDF